jgi:DNA-directed RNA polymerase specialized sigma24 family protein
MMREMSFAEWYRDNHPGLVDAAVRTLGQPALAADAVDEACERALARWARVQSMRSPSGWVLRVAVNEARRQLRHEARDRDLGPFLSAPTEQPPPGGETWLVVDELPPRQRLAVILRHVAGLTEAEIAERMGVTRSTISSTLASAYRRLATDLGDEPPTEETPAPMTLSLAVARACDDDGCDVEPVDGGQASSRRARYSDAVRDTIKVRPGDLVALDGDTIVWRWWHGTVVAVDATNRAATVRRNATQRADGDPRTTDLTVDVPADLAADLAAGDVVYFGTEDDRKVVIATAAPEVVTDRVAPKLPTIAELLR